MNFRFAIKLFVTAIFALLAVSAVSGEVALIGMERRWYHWKQASGKSTYRMLFPSWICQNSAIEESSLINIKAKAHVVYESLVKQLWRLTLILIKVDSLLHSEAEPDCAELPFSAQERFSLQLIVSMDLRRRRSFWAPIRLHTVLSIQSSCRLQSTNFGERYCAFDSSNCSYYE